jgi:hypothetical protein
MDDFWPSRARHHRCGLDFVDLAAVGTIREISNLVSCTRVQEPRLADLAVPPVGSSDTSGLSSLAARWGRFFWARPREAKGNLSQGRWPKNPRY